MSGDEVFTDGTGHIVAIEPASGSETWRSPLLGDVGFGLGPVAAAPFDDRSAVAFLMEGYPGRVLVLDSATGQIRWEVDPLRDYASLVHLDGSTIVADGGGRGPYDGDDGQVWEVASPVIERNPDLIGPGELVVDQGRLFVAGYDVLEIDPATDVAIVGDRLIVADGARSWRGPSPLVPRPATFARASETVQARSHPGAPSTSQARSVADGHDL